LRCTSELYLAPIYAYRLLTHLASSLFQALPHLPSPPRLSSYYRISRLTIPRSIRRRYANPNPILSRIPTYTSRIFRLHRSHPDHLNVRHAYSQGLQRDNSCIHPTAAWSDVPTSMLRFVSFRPSEMQVHGECIISSPSRIFLLNLHGITR
jgi:hypothetical protein